jgi:hypothetical protein
MLKRPAWNRIDARSVEKGAMRSEGSSTGLGSSSATSASSNRCAPWRPRRLGGTRRRPMGPSRLNHLHALSAAGGSLRRDTSPSMRAATACATDVARRCRCRARFAVSRSAKSGRSSPDPKTTSAMSASACASTYSQYRSLPTRLRSFRSQVRARRFSWFSDVRCRPTRRCSRTNTSVAALPRLFAAERQGRWADTGACI